MSGLDDWIAFLEKGGTPALDPLSELRVAGKFGLMPDSPREVAEKALEAARIASETARLVKAESGGMMTELRQRLDRQDEEDTKHRDRLWDYLRERDKKWDAFQSDFDKVDIRSNDHHRTLFGDPRIKGDTGILGSVGSQGKFITHAKWHIGIGSALFSAFCAYMVFFYGDDMKRGVFKPSEDELTRVINRVVHNWFPDAKWPENKPPPDKH